MINARYITGVLLSLVIFSCSDEFTNNESGKEYVLDSQLQEMMTTPEGLLNISTLVTDATYGSLRESNVWGEGAHDDYGQKSVDLNLDLMSNDMIQRVSHWHGGAYNYTYRGVENTRGTGTIWKFYYKIIRNANIVSQWINEGGEVSDTENLNALGRVQALRAFAYFQLIRLYANGDLGVPLLTPTSENMGRVNTNEVIEFIKQDIQDAYDNLEGYSRSSKDAIDQDVAAGLMARIALEYGDYETAIEMAQQARGAGTLLDFDALNDGFSDINNSEWIWGATITNQTSTIYASFFSQMASLSPGYAGALGVYKMVDKRLYEEIEDTDERKAWFIGPDAVDPPAPAYANIKFVDPTFFEGDYLYMRVSEMVLIEAEARALNGDDSGAAQALYDLVSKRDPSYALSSNTGQALLDEIRLHRSIELWGEGFAFFDMKRWERPLQRTYEGTNHPAYGRLDYPANSHKFVFQIPQDELNANSEITEQNPN